MFDSVPRGHLAGHFTDGLDKHEGVGAAVLRMSPGDGERVRLDTGR